MRYVVVTRLPFEHEPQLSDKEIVEKNLFTNNVGNLFFTNSVIRTLLKPGNEIVRYKKGLDLNSFDKGILIHANVIRSGCEHVFDYDYNIVSNSNIPFVMMSIGADSNKNFETSLNDGIKERVKSLFNLMLERTPSIGVRGEYTKRVLVEQCDIDSDKIKVIGCPSVRYFGNNLLKHRREFKPFSNDMKIAVNFTAYHYDLDEAIYLYHVLKNYNNSYVIFTDKVEAEMLWYNKPVPESRQHEVLPTSRNHFVIKEGRGRFCANQKSIMKMLNSFDFSIGSRIHQSIVAILSGCPALLIAHSTRVLEIAQYHKIPYILRSDLVSKNPPLEELYYKTLDDMETFYKEYNNGLKDYVDYLCQADLDINPDFIPV